MKLTSYNIAVKALNAKCCLSDIVTRMWGYMEEGDVDKAHCAREKAVLLTGLIDTLERWTPVIPEGKTITYTIVITAGNLTFPYSLAKFTVNGMSIINPLYVYGSDNGDVIEAVTDNVNCFISPNDDILQATSSNNSTDTFILSMKYVSSLSPLVIDTNGFEQNVTISTTISDETDITETPYCLTNTQLLSVVKKIDEICECGC